MMSRMTAVAQSDQIGRLVTSASRPRHKVMNISLGATARPFAFDAPELVAPKYAFSNPEPIPLDCSYHTNLAHWTVGAKENSVSSNVRTAVPAARNPP